MRRNNKRYSAVQTMAWALALVLLSASTVQARPVNTGSVPSKTTETEQQFHKLSPGAVAPQLAYVINNSELEYDDIEPDTFTTLLSIELEKTVFLGSGAPTILKSLAELAEDVDQTNEWHKVTVRPGVLKEQLKSVALKIGYQKVVLTDQAKEFASRFENSTTMDFEGTRRKVWSSVLSNTPLKAVEWEDADVVQIRTR